MKAKIYESQDGGVLVILQYLNGSWHTTHGGDFYVYDGARSQWLPYDHVGFYRWLQRNGIARFSVGAKHEIHSGGRWKKVDQYGLFKYVESLPEVRFGSRVTDTEWDAIMAQVLDDMVYAKEHGRLP
jgi:hypothetical protein